MPFGPEHYVPILKGKKGELDALSHVDAGIVGSLTPLIELPFIAWDYNDDGPAKTAPEHSKRFAKQLGRAWPARPVFIDPVGFREDVDSAVNPNLLVVLLTDLRAEPVAFVPVVRLIDADEGVLAAAGSEITEDGRGICLRARESDFDEDTRDDVATDILNAIHELDLGPGGVDLVIDLGGPELHQARSRLIMRAALDCLAIIPRLDDWRTLSVAMAAFPTNVSDHIGPGTQGAISRRDAEAWVRIREHCQANDIRVPTYSDYGADSAEYVDFDPRMMKPAASIRYTSKYEWLVFRGRAVRGAGSVGFTQYRQLASDCVGHADFRGEPFSHGDGCIAQTADGRAGTGSLTTWRMVATNHHLTHVVDALASRNEP